MTLSPEKPGRSDNADLAALVRTIADYPKAGVMFRDVSTLLLDGPGFHSAIDRLADSFDADGVDKIAGIEARGFIIASALAYKLGKGVVMLRKSGKLPGEAVGVDYALEYGTDRIEMHIGAVDQHMRVLLVDDLIATGGTALAGVELLRGQGAHVVEARFLIDLPDLGGAKALAQAGVQSRALISFEGD
ncbi:MAG: adenine phosphoribosyltransferase [Sphingobium sp.]|nr:adenine phosphoribosyltransferase [Sphingobium sp.]